MFKTKIFHEGKMYLLVSDVTKMMEISEKAFCKKYSDKIVDESELVNWQDLKH